MTLVPLPQRVVMSVLFYEIRLLLRTLKRCINSRLIFDAFYGSLPFFDISAPWPSRVVSWVTDTRSTLDETLAQTEREEECTRTLTRLSTLYLAAQEERRPVTSVITAVESLFSIT